MLKPILFIYPVLCTTLLLTACDKSADKSTTTTKTTATSTTTTSPATTATSSTSAVAATVPTAIDIANNKTVTLDAATTKIEVTDPKTHQTIQITPAGQAVANILKNSIVALVLKANDQAKPTIPAAKCLLSPASELPYYGVSQRWLIQNLTPEEIKKFDDFYTGEFGAKAKTIANEKAMQAFAGVTPEHPTTYTPEEKKKSLAQENSPETKKLRTLMQKDLQGDTPFTKELIDITNKEIDRCNAIS